MTAMKTCWALLVALVVEAAHHENTKVPLLFSNITLFEGDSCTLPYNDPGVCSRMQDCGRIVQVILAGGKPQICSYDRNEPVVCCPVNDYKPQYSAINRPTERQPGDKAKEACEDYYQTFKNLSTDNGCHPLSSPEGIIDGRNASYLDATNVAAIGYGEKDNIGWFCGGSLISPKFVLTAGHCLLSGQKGPASWVRLGDLNLTSPEDDEHAQQFSVLKHFAHPNYRPPSHYNDVGLLLLDREIEWTVHVNPACLHMGDGPLIAIEALGWGLTDWADAKGSDILMKVGLYERSVEDCQKSLQSVDGTSRLQHGYENASMLCVGDLGGSKDTCNGDSGGPLQFKELMTTHCMYRVVGVTSFGAAACGVTKSPAVYSRVAHFVPWIESVVWP